MIIYININCIIHIWIFSSFISDIVKDYMIEEDMMNNINNDSTVIIFIIYKEYSFRKDYWMKIYFIIKNLLTIIIKMINYFNNIIWIK